MSKKRNEPPRRQRSARSDAGVGSIEEHAADTYGLPPDAVRIVRPDGTDARGDKLIETCDGCTTTERSSRVSMVAVA